jgi:glycerate 2-kinase
MENSGNENEEELVSLRVVVAPNAYKGTLSATEASEVMSEATKEVVDKAVVVEKPMADGGDGTSLVLAHVMKGEVRWTQAPDPLGRLAKAHFVRLDEETFAVDVSSASGYVRLSLEERDVMRATSEGTGVLCKKALDRGAKRILLGVGGTAFMDGGVGMLRALGVRFLDADGHSTKPGAEDLHRIRRIELFKIPQEVTLCDWILALDVDNPLLGERGAASVYGPQKGADSREVSLIETGLAQLAHIVEDLTGETLKDRPGTGAGGGLPFSVQGLLGAKSAPGGELVASWIGLHEAVEKADLVVTGEGCLDAQTLYGKAPAVVAKVANQRGVPVVAVAGKLGVGVEKLKEVGIVDYIDTSKGEGIPKNEKEARQRLFLGTKDLLRRFLKRLS